jgi:hypothetical protein
MGRIAFGGRIMNDLNLDPKLPHSQLSVHHANEYLSEKEGLKGLVLDS